MNVREMHIEVTQSSQQLGANKRRKLFPSEIDWVLNKQQDRLIANSVPGRTNTRGFAYDADDLTKLKELYVKKELPVYTSDPFTGYAFFPPLLEHYISCDSYIRQLCNDPRPSTATASFTTTRFSFTTTTKSAAPFYENITINKASTELLNLATYVNAKAETSYIGLNNKPEIFLLREVVMQRLLELGEECYWESYGNRYFAGQLIIVSTATYQLFIDGVEVAGTKETTDAQSYSGTGVWKANRMYSPETAQTLSQAAFSSTYYESPLCEMSNKSILIYTDSSFIVSRLRINYIRKPKKISLILGQDCELKSEWVQRQICDLSVEYIQKVTADPNWESKLQDNIQRTTI